ncbi:MAG: type II secretion system GspH family protein [Patescibacteria group bacterium]|nr:type II secretion system GspH family protein [Patescibacteria group bacterium]
MVAIMILAIITAAVISLMLAVISLNGSAKLKNQSVAAAQQAMEQLRNYYQVNGFQTLYNKANNKCYYFADDGLTLTVLGGGCPISSPQSPACVSGQPVTGNLTLSRYIKLTINSGAVLAQVFVNWPDVGGICRVQELDSSFYSY